MFHTRRRETDVRSICSGAARNSLCNSGRGARSTGSGPMQTCASHRLRANPSTADRPRHRQDLPGAARNAHFSACGQDRLSWRPAAPARQRAFFPRCGPGTARSKPDFRRELQRITARAHKGDMTGEGLRGIKVRLAIVSDDLLNLRVSPSDGDLLPSLDVIPASSTPTSDASEERENSI